MIIDGYRPVDRQVFLSFLESGRYRKGWLACGTKENRADAEINSDLGVLRRPIYGTKEEIKNYTKNHYSSAFIFNESEDGQIAGISIPIGRSSGYTARGCIQFCSTFSSASMNIKVRKYLDGTFYGEW